MSKLNLSNNPTFISTSTTPTRRQLLASAAVTSLGVTHVAQAQNNSKPIDNSSPSPEQNPSITAPSDTVRLACIGVARRGWHDMNSVAAHPKAQVTSLVDVDTTAYAGGLKKYGEHVSTWTDWRHLFETAPDSFDAITIATPDHMHAPIALTAMRLNKHVYVEKPLCHTLHECRTLFNAGKQHNVIVQMGNQAHSDLKHDWVKKLLQQGFLGKIQAVHAWSNRPIWPQGGDAPTESNPVPNTLHWYEWLGVAADRPYVRDQYHTFKWRGYWDFGTGALGDMGCHIMDVAIDALQLNHCLSVICDPAEPTRAMHPSAETITLDFAPTPYTASNGLPMTWYDGGRRPNTQTAPVLQTIRGKLRLADNGRIFVGDKGFAVSDHYGDIAWFDLQGNPLKAPTPESVQATGVNHHQGFIEAILLQQAGQDPSHYNRSNLSAACPLTEACLLGALASRFPNEKLLWDSANLRFTNSEQANQLIHKTYRTGWEVTGL